MTGHHHQNFKTFSSTQQKNEIAPPYLLHHHSSSPSECLHVHGHASWKWKWLSKLLPQTDILTNPRHDPCVANLIIEENHASAAWLCSVHRCNYVKSKGRKRESPRNMYNAQCTFPYNITWQQQATMHSYKFGIYILDVCVHRIWCND